MAYVQSQLRQGFSSGQTIADLVLVCIDSFSANVGDEPAPINNNKK
ncbi:MAG TPA: hypothetical protein VGY54_02355 [Polyangiaceae bacterium]|jgi:hypothetical protein|nr:hypothetical protein [Polyangiaceae bacterium]